LRFHREVSLLRRAPDYRREASPGGCPRKSERARPSPGYRSRRLILKQEAQRRELLFRQKRAKGAGQVGGAGTKISGGAQEDER